MNKIDLIINALDRVDTFNWNQQDNKLIKEARIAARELGLNYEPEQKLFNRLIRIMGTFDLATGHADNWNDLLDSLESELRDVLGHYREALKPDHGFDRTASHMAGEYVSTNQQNVNTSEERVHKSDKSIHEMQRLGQELEQEPVAWLYNGHFHECDPSEWAIDDVIPLYTAPTKHEWIGLTDEGINEVLGGDIHQEQSGELRFIQAIEAKLREKNT